MQGLVRRDRVHEQVATHLLSHGLVWNRRLTVVGGGLLGQGILDPLATLAVSRLEAELVLRRRVAAASAHLAVYSRTD